MPRGKSEQAEQIIPMLREVEVELGSGKTVAEAVKKTGVHTPARGPPADWRELVQVHDDRAIFQGRIDELPVIDIRSL